MSFGALGSRVFMDEIIFHRMWMEKNGPKEECELEDSDESQDSDMRQLFPNSKKSCKEEQKIPKNGPPEWLAVFVGVFFVAGVAGIASYQAYSLDYKNELSNVDIHVDDVAQDAPPYVPLYNEILLPKSLLPKAYVLYIHPNFQTLKYNGLVKISFFCQNETSRIILHSSKHKIKKIEVKATKSNSAALKVKKTFRNREREMLIMELQEALEKGQNYDILLAFEYNLTNDVSNGIYLSHYKDFGGNKHLMVSTEFEPTNARRAFPCFDEPELKATFQIIILHTNENDYFAASNMPVDKQVSFGKQRTETHFKVTPVMSTYLVVFAVTQYEYKQVKSTRGVMTKVYAPKGRLQETEVAATVAPLCIDFFEEKFDMEYSLPKLDVIPITAMSAGADETWGLNIFVEPSLLYDKKTGTVSNLENVVKTIAHEFSHQWFGDLVTMKWWNDLWLKESFAAYLEFLPIQKFYPSWDTQTAFFLDNIHAALNFDASNFTHPINSDEIDPDQLRSTYDIITYQKGASVVSMLSNFLGQKIFFKGVKIYLTKYAYGNADADQFWQAMTEATNGTIDVVSFMHEWVKQGGFPLVTVKRNESVLMLSQEEFDQKNSSTLWHVPLKIKTAKNASIFSYTLAGRSASFAIDEDSVWYKANYGATGFYRVNYDAMSWKNLLQLLNDDHMLLPSIDRANLLSDIIALSLHNYHNISTALDFTRYLNKEHHYVPWSVGLNLLFKIRRQFSETKLKGCVENYLLEQIDSPLKYLNTQKEHNHVEKHLIHMLLGIAVTLKKEPITTELENMFLKWVISDGANSIPGSLRQIVFDAGIKYGQLYEWDYLFKRYQEAPSSEEQTVILKSLAITEDVDILQRYVDYASNSSFFKPSQKVEVFMSVCGNKYGRDLAWKVVQKDWSVYERYARDAGVLHFLLDVCLINGNTKNDLEKAKSFFDNINITKFKATADRILESIKWNIEFVKQKDEIERWFKRHVPKCV